MTYLMRCLLSFSLFLFAIVLIGCTPAVRQTDDSENRHGDVLPAERLVKKLEANRRTIKTFAGSGDLTLKTREFESSASFYAVLKKPDSMFVTILGPFGIELAEVLVTDTKFFFYEAMNNIEYSGARTDDVLESIFKVSLTFQELTDAFTGSVNLSDMLYRTPDEYEINKDVYVLKYSDAAAKKTMEYTVAIGDLAIVRYRVFDAKGAVQLEAEYSKFEIVEGVPVPAETVITYKVKNQQITIIYDSMEANKKGTRIEYTVPDDADKISW